MKIGELAQLANCTPDTIRFYEKEGLLPPARRTDANYRVYDENHVMRLRFIRNCRALDMTHDEVRALLEAVDESAPSCGELNGLLDEHLSHVKARIAELEQLREQLTALQDKCRGEHPVEDCGILHELTSRETAHAAKKSHL